MSVLAGGRSFNDAVSLIGNLPSIGVGVHLCLVEEKPVLAASLVPSLVDENGTMHANYRKFLLRLWGGRINLREIEIELEAQIGKLQDRKITLTHLDVHQYLHLVPEVLAIVVKLAARHKIRWIRFPVRMRGMQGFTLRGFAKWAWLSFSAKKQAARIQGQGISLPDYSYATGTSGRLSTQIVKTCLHQISEGVSDLTCHPGCRPEDNRYSNWNYRWENELAALTDPEVMRLLDELHIKLGNYDR